MGAARVWQTKLHARRDGEKTRTDRLGVRVPFDVVAVVVGPCFPVLAAKLVRDLAHRERAVVQRADDADIPTGNRADEEAHDAPRIEYGENPL